MTGKQGIESHRNEDVLARRIETSGPVFCLVIEMPGCNNEVANEDTDTFALVRSRLANPVAHGKRYECLKPILSGHETGSLSGRRNLAHLAEGDKKNKS
ncbi:hypothetical protein EH31_11345 [Erythrobacter longus]|uniref:Uncharacterized protein n=1 Tax=Erythrobacter longus TaxID=1044 RepID=A0A074M8K2_ERYLO|nr:hypothetical protein EH31_11345 [Erythrobacter longus]